MNVSSNSTITVRIFGDNKRETAIEYRIFKNIQDSVRYYAVRQSKTTFLARDLNLPDIWIYCNSVSNLQIPDPTTNNAGVVLINGERIIYGVVDLINNRLGNIRRATAGTGAATVHQAGTLVVDTSTSLEIPNSQDTLITANTATYITNNAGASILIKPNQTFLQGKLFMNIGESIETSTSQAAQFIREP